MHANEKEKKKSTPLGMFERPQIDRGVPSLLFKSNKKQKDSANEGQTFVLCTSSVWSFCTMPMPMNPSSLLETIIARPANFQVPQHNLLKLDLAVAR